MPRFRYLPHTAEVKFVAYGKDFAGALENAALALLNVMLDVNRIRKAKGTVKSLKIKEKGETREDVAWYILQDILSKTDEKTLSAYEFKVNKASEGKKKGIVEVAGELRYKNLNENFSLLEVKAVTPHALAVKKGKVWSITAVLDV